MKKLLFIASLAFMASCTEQDNIQTYKPNSVGTQGKVDIIMHETLWEGRLGEIVRDKLSPLIEYYPGDEYLFDIAHSTKKRFNMGSKKQKNIIEFEINSNPNLKSGLSYSTDIWATDQNMVKILGKNQQDLYEIFYSNSQEIQDYFMELELTRLRVKLLKNKNFLAEKQLRQKHQLSLTIPNDMQLSINNKSVAIMERRRLVSKKQQSPGDVQEFILVYHYPYTSKEQLSKKNLLQMRDSIVGKYFKGKAAGSYMTTAPDSLVPSFEKERLFKGNYAYEIRGIYSMVNGFRGGPFVNISLVDETRGRIITVEAHVFAPKFSKRAYMMDLETMLNTLSIE